MVGVAVILLLALLCVLGMARDVLLLGFLAVLIANVLLLPIAHLQRWMPRALATVASLLLLTAILAGIGWLMVPRLVHQGRQLIEKIPDAAERLDRWSLEAREVQSVAQVPGAEDIRATVRERVRKAVAAAVNESVPIAITTVEAAFGAVLLLIMAAFFAYRPDDYRAVVRATVPTRFEDAFDETWNRLALGLRHWMRGIVVSMTLMGAFTAVLLYAAGIHGWLVLGLLTCLGTFIPYLGAIASSVPGLVMSLAQSPTHFLYACGVYLGVHMIEGYLVQPLIMKRAVEIHPGILLFWQTLIGVLFGVLGVVVATPLLVCVQIALGYLYVERSLGKRDLHGEAALS